MNAFLLTSDNLPTHQRKEKNFPVAWKFPLMADMISPSLTHTIFTNGINENWQRHSTRSNLELAISKVIRTLIVDCRRQALIPEK
jgi:hypothetical protein